MLKARKIAFSSLIFCVTSFVSHDFFFFFQQTLSRMYLNIVLVKIKFQSLGALETLFIFSNEFNNVHLLISSNNIPVAKQSS